MPIKAFNTSAYEAVPDEDVTPLNSNVARMAKRHWKTFRTVVAVAIGILFVCGVLYTGYYAFDTSSNDIVIIYETAADSIESGGILPLQLHKVQEVVPSLRSLAFGNLDCSPGSECTSRFAEITVSAETYQEILGFGGAFTEASAYHFYKLPASLQKKVIDLYFGEGGIKYSLGRVHINSCDFSLSTYSFDDSPNDYNLMFFDTDVTHDSMEIIPFIQEAMDASSLSIRLVASPWSPPAWMKVPVKGVQSMTGSATPNGLKDDPKVKTTWAQYLSKFVRAYQNKGVDIWAITPQNEPEFPAPWEACAFNASFESDFIQKYLGPVFRHNHPDVKILAFDHNKDHLEAWSREILGADTSNQFVDGMAFHWYGGMDRMTDGTYGYEALRAVHNQFPDTLLLGTEGCSCPGVQLNNWLRAERLGHDIMYDLLHFAQGWIDWNLLLDDKGGPNHLGNNCDAALLAMKDHSILHVQPKYHYMGHFSKFVLPGSVRRGSRAVGDYQYAMLDPNIQANIELAMHPCEKSTRQMWLLNDGSGSGLGRSGSSLGSEAQKLRLLAATSNGEVRTEGGGAGGVHRLCVAQGEGNRQFLRLMDCDVQDSSVHFLLIKVTALLQQHEQSQQQRSTGDGESTVLQLQDTVTGLCVTAMLSDRPADDLSADDTSQLDNTGGALLTLTPCLTAAAHEGEDGGDAIAPLFRGQSFVYRRDTDELRLATGEDLDGTANSSMHPVRNRQCLTAGWPFFNAVSFTVPASDSLSVNNAVVSGGLLSKAKPQTVVVAMNEASAPMPIRLFDQAKNKDVVYRIAPRSIQTIVY